MARGARRAASWMLCALLFVVARGVRAESSVVVLLRPASASTEVDEAITRAQAELRAEGFATKVRRAPNGSDTRAMLSRAAERDEAVAAISIFGAGQGAAADLWVTDRVTGKTVIRTVDVSDVEPARRPAALAIRAVELLRASLVEALRREDSAAEPPPDVPEDVAEWMEPARSPLAGPSLQLGVGALFSVDELGAAGAPLVRFAYGSESGLAGRLLVLGPAFGAGADGPLGSASVRQELLALELAWAPEVAWAGFTPILWTGVGGFHLHAEGELRPPRVGRSDEVWAAVFVGGASLGYRLTDDIAALLDAGALLTVPRAVVSMEGVTVGSVGRPSVLASLGVLARF